MSKLYKMRQNNVKMFLDFLNTDVETVTSVLTVLNILKNASKAVHEHFGQDEKVLEVVEDSKSFKSVNPKCNRNSLSYHEGVRVGLIMGTGILVNQINEMNIIFQDVLKNRTESN